ncbi:hypothetical protein XYCOK13_24130 [Xylanibacillus composti]|uniref:histidine kinase n=1 Tax=Xylanibacillus composti TaxID=1572762 RepID=A0A8J4M2E7_9BACL|nr:ATP-binding protein [Xylanibacillus composti]GIQ69589.1 hypothetical protein XYCOK13_24130 [Xylanibacillus composti]
MKTKLSTISPSRSIFLKLFVSMLLIIVISYLLTSLLFSLLFRKDVRHIVERNLVQVQHRIAHHIQDAYEMGLDRPSLVASMDLALGHPDRVFSIYNAQGDLLYTIGGEQMAITEERSKVLQAMRGISVEGVEPHEEAEVYYVASPILQGLDTEEKAILIASREFGREVRRPFGPILWSLIISIPVSAIILFFVSRKLTTPLKEMSETALSFAGGELSRRVPVKSADEIGQLGESLNYMAEELSSLEKMRQGFLANVSHDLRSPLTSIHGFLAGILDGTIQPERERHYLMMMKDSTDRMRKLVSDLLDMAKIESGQFDMDPCPFNLSEELRRTIAQLEPLFVQKKMKVELIHPPSDAYVYADPVRIGQVIVNLLQNAIQHSPLHSQVTVVIQLAEEDVSVSISDQGAGIRQEDLDKIWDRFYKGDKARTHKTGTGLGLAIVKHILTLHQSKISLESSKGKGTRIQFTLPAHMTGTSLSIR